MHLAPGCQAHCAGDYGEFGHLRFEVAGGLTAEPGEEVSVPVGRKAKAMYLLHGARLLDREAMVEALKDKQHWAGVPVAEYVVS